MIKSIKTLATLLIISTAFTACIKVEKKSPTSRTEVKKRSFPNPLVATYIFKRGMYPGSELVDTTSYTEEEIEQILEQEAAEYLEAGYEPEAESQASQESIARIADSIQTAEIEAEVKRATRARMLREQAAAPSVNGRYSSESSQATYRLTISNGRWSFSTAIKVSGMGISDYSNGIEVNGTLYEGAVAVGSANGRCARVGSSPRMCK
tara:strand:- start:439 stop:1062 length:624 start_codon:yes stop_codon:yes gene_type:complete